MAKKEGTTIELSPNTIITEDEIVGADIGNYSTEVTGEGFEHTQVSSILFSPTAFEPIDQDRAIAVENLMNNLKVHVMSEQNNIDGYYYVGQNALVQEEKPRLMDINYRAKATDEIPITMVLSLIAANKVQELFKKNPNLERIETAVYLTTAIPQTEYSKEAAERLEKRFVGKHSITVYYADTKCKVEINVKEAKVTQEGKTAMLYLSKVEPDAFKSYREYYGKDIVITNDTTSLHHDIGNGTTETTYMEGATPTTAAGLEKGIGHAFEQAARLYCAGMTLSLNRHDFEKILRTNTPRGEKAKECLAKSMVDLKAAMLKHMKSSMDNVAKGSADYIFVHGGGSIRLKPYIINDLYELAKKYLFEVVYIEEEYATHLNSRGCYELGKILFSAKVGA